MNVTKIVSGFCLKKPKIRQEKQKYLLTFVQECSIMRTCVIKTHNDWTIGEYHDSDTEGARPYALCRVCGEACVP